MTVITESFNKADSAGWDVDQTWTTLTGDPITVSNAADRNLSFTVATVAGSGIGNDQYVQAEVQGGRFQGVVARATDVNNYYYSYKTAAGASTIALYKITAGSSSLLGTSTGTYGAGATIRIECEGTTIRLICNSVEEVSVTDPDHTTGNPGGRIQNDGGDGFDNWEAGDITTDQLYIPVPGLWTVKGMIREASDAEAASTNSAGRRLLLNR